MFNNVNSADNNHNFKAIAKALLPRTCNDCHREGGTKSLEGGREGKEGGREKSFKKS